MSSRCTDKLCNLYYGDPPTDDPDQATAAPRATDDPAVPTTFAEAEDGAALPRERGRATEGRPDCAPSPQDPWRCYRR